MTLSINKKTYLTIFLAAALILGGIAFSANAQLEDASQCTVRADVDADAVENLSGGQLSGSRSAGQTLDITGPDSGANAIVCTYSLVLWVTTILFVALLAIAALFIVMAAFFFVSAAGSEEKRGKAKSFFLYAIVGIVVAVIARVIPAIVQGLIGLQ